MVAPDRVSFERAHLENDLAMLEAMKERHLKMGVQNKGDEMARTSLVAALDRIETYINMRIKSRS